MPKETEMPRKQEVLDYLRSITEGKTLEVYGVGERNFEPWKLIAEVENETVLGKKLYHAAIKVKDQEASSGIRHN